ncbi:nickel-type superoxide dismutase maturation protease [Psychromonas aquatilis]|uniref:Nickel-type superoxide dismutase maturation protease n=1 Tax=Psychromonas aquatilis TaxID=2005072 RepID=A0ABU9GNU2_9GAMM
MSPIIPANSFLLFHHWIRPNSLKVGLLVKVNHPIYGLIIKQVCQIDKNNSYWLKGLNDSSVTTEQMGPIRINRIKGIVCYKILAKSN